MTDWDNAIAAMNPIIWLKMDGNLNDSSGTNPTIVADKIWEFIPNTDAFGSGACGHRLDSTSGSTKITAKTAPLNYSISIMFKYEHPYTYTFLFGGAYSGQFRVTCGNTGIYFNRSTLSFAVEGVNFDTAAPIGAYLDGRWHMFVLVADTVKSTVYADGVPLGTFGRAARAPLPPINMPYSRSDYSTGVSYGWFDELIVFGYPLTDADVAQLWAVALTAGFVDVLPAPIPGQRFALDVDGSKILCNAPNGDTRRLSQSQMRIIMSENEDSVVFPDAESTAMYGEKAFYVLFPEPRDIRAMYVIAYAGSSRPDLGYSGGWAANPIIDVSLDTTNGQDGTWSYNALHLERGRGVSLGCGQNDYYQGGPGSYLLGDCTGWGRPVPETVAVFSGRTIDATLVESREISSIGANGLTSSISWAAFKVNPENLLQRVSSVSGITNNIRGLRFRTQVWDQSRDSDGFMGHGLQLLHIYGQKSARSDADYLMDIWQTDTSLPMPLAISAQGAASLRSSSDMIFKVRNSSSRSIAYDISIFGEALADNPKYSFSSQLMFRFSHESVFNKSLTLLSLAPGETSEPLIVRRVTPVTATEGQFYPRIVAAVGRWV